MCPGDAGVDAGGHSPSDVTLGFFQGGPNRFFDLVDILDLAFLYPLGCHDTGSQHLQFALAPHTGHDGGNFIGADVYRGIESIFCQSVTFLISAVSGSDPDLLGISPTRAAGLPAVWRCDSLGWTGPLQRTALSPVG